ncbi:MAG: ATP-binding protein [Pirellulales bacterium]
MSDIPDYEKIGKFYLGKQYDLGNRQVVDELVLYDSKDLTTHAMCVGMTGSGKTGLCLALLEEAAIDGIPAICIDPKGDLGNLLLTFPELAPQDFQEWIDPSEATRLDKPLEELAKETASRWRDGLAKWHQAPERIKKFKDAVDISIYTPGSKIGLPLTVLKSFDAPPELVRQDAEAMREKVSGAASGLLTLLGMEADPLTSREHILISNILHHAWSEGKNLDLGELIRQIQTPPIQRVGVVDLETFLPTEQRVKLAMSLNNLLASPAFAGWLEGESLDIKKLLYTADGKPRLSILSIAHLNDAERMFFVTLLLGELLTWMRSQPGTGSLRALFYMDEVFGYFPPSAKPPSKEPMLTLLKQARAFGLGICLATQNPVDLDYKGLSNMGTWFLGRLQTARDKERVLEGLEGAAIQQGQKFDRAAMEQQLSALGNRVFLMNNVHDDGPTLFQSRWALSFLRGPLSRDQIQRLMREKKAGPASTGAAKLVSPVEVKSGTRPIVPADVVEKFLIPTKVMRSTGKIVYRPAILAQASVHYVKATSSLDHWMDVRLMVNCQGGLSDPIWDSSIDIAADELQLSSSPDAGYTFSELPAELSSARNFNAWEKQLGDYLFRNRPVKIYYSKALKKASNPGQTEADARIELAQAARELRDAQTEKLKTKYADKFKSLEKRILTAEHRLEKEREQSKQQNMQSMFQIGATVLGALLGNKIASKTTISKASTAARGLGRAAAERGDVARANESLEELMLDKQKLEDECQADIDEVSSQFSAENLTLEEIEVPLRKSDTRVQLLALVWVPWHVDEQGIATPLIAM